MTLQYVGDLLIYTTAVVLGFTVAYYFWFARWEVHISGRHVMWWTMWTEALFVYWAWGAWTGQSVFDPARNWARIILAVGFMFLSAHRLIVIWCALHPDHPYALVRAERERLRRIKYDTKRMERQTRRFQKK